MSSDKPFALARGPHLALYMYMYSAAEEALQAHGVFRLFETVLRADLGLF